MFDWSVLKTMCSPKSWISPSLPLCLSCQDPLHQASSSFFPPYTPIVCSPGQNRCRCFTLAAVSGGKSLWMLIKRTPPHPTEHITPTAWETTHTLHTRVMEQFGCRSIPANIHTSAQNAKLHFPHIHLPQMHCVKKQHSQMNRSSMLCNQHCPHSQQIKLI